MEFSVMVSENKHKCTSCISLPVFASPLYVPIYKIQLKLILFTQLNLKRTARENIGVNFGIFSQVQVFK